jgi:hypothetical protein
MIQWNPNRYQPKDARIDRANRAELPPVLAQAHAKASRLIAAEAIKPDSFKGLYGDEVIAKDLAQAHSLEARFNHDNERADKMGAIFEGVVLEQAELSNWLGQSAETIKSSAYDDYVNGIDMMIEFDADKNSPKHLALAVDLTFGTASLKKKFDRIRKEIDADELGHMKYFRSERSGYRGELSQLPRAIVGVEHDTVAQLAALWVNDHKPQLAQHEVQRIIAEELNQQMKTFLAYARKKKSEKAISAYERASRITGMMVEEKKKIAFNEFDRVFQSIRSELLTF